MSFKAIARPGDIGEFGLAGRYVDYRTQFDGIDPNIFLRADTLDNSRAITKAVRGWVTLGRGLDAPWSGTLEAQYLQSSNDNFNDRTFLNTTSGDRLRISAQGVARFAIGEVTAACVLGYLDFRFPDEKWRATRPGLEKWFERISQRPSVKATVRPA